MEDFPSRWVSVHLRELPWLPRHEICSSTAATAQEPPCTVSTHVATTQQSFRPSYWMDKSFETHLPLENATLSNHLSKTEDKTQWNLLSQMLQTSDHTPGKLRTFPVWTRWPLWSLLTWYSIIMTFQLKKKKKKSPFGTFYKSFWNSPGLCLSVKKNKTWVTERGELFLLAQWGVEIFWNLEVITNSWMSVQNPRV